MKMKMKQMACKMYWTNFKNVSRNILMVATPMQYAEQAVVGDQLTVERGVNGLFEVANGFTAEERHEGLHFEIADFHGGMKFLEVSINVISNKM